VFIPCDGPVGKFFQARLTAATSWALADHECDAAVSVLLVD